MGQATTCWNKPSPVSCQGTTTQINWVEKVGIGYCGLYRPNIWCFRWPVLHISVTAEGLYFRSALAKITLIRRVIIYTIQRNARTDSLITIGITIGVTRLRGKSRSSFQVSCYWIKSWYKPVSNNVILYLLIFIKINAAKLMKHLLNGNTKIWWFGSFRVKSFSKF